MMIIKRGMVNGDDSFDDFDEHNVDAEGENDNALVFLQSPSSLFPLTFRCCPSTG